jgi:hypothetical protein
MLARFVCVFVLCNSLLLAQQSQKPSLTIYNQEFAVVKQEIPLDLNPGENEITVNDITMHLEPDSVILRDPSGKHVINVLEQNYRADPVSRLSLLSLYEGRTIDFELPDHSTVKGKVIRSGYLPADYFDMNGYVQRYPGREEAIIEVNGRLRFDLPGTPIFPDLTAETILKPRLEWLLTTDKPGRFPAEFSYVTGGLTWQADYNVIAPEKGDVVDVVGWVTMENRSGKTFESACIKLMAGDVNKIARRGGGMAGGIMAQSAAASMPPPVTERAFDEYHLYTLERTTTLRDRETKQVEFIRASGVIAKQVYVYDGLKIDSNRYNGWNWENFRNDHSYGTESNRKIWVMREFRNSDANHLGMPLPKGRVRFYRRSDDGQVEFTGENMIDHTPHDEAVGIYTGNAFDLSGERRQTDYTLDTAHNTATESFEIKVRNHKKEPCEVRVVEHLYRGETWEIVSKSSDYKKNDSNTIEFPIAVSPDEEKTITYTARYTW